MTRPSFAIILMTWAFASAAWAAADVKPEGASSTKPDDLLGRWTLAMVYHSNRDDGSSHMMLDIVPCGTMFCGMKVSEAGECQQKILTYTDKAVDHSSSEGNELSDRYTGRLDWNDETAKYYVTIDLYDLDPGANTKGSKSSRQLGMNGFPASNGVPSVYDARSYPLTVEFRYIGPAKCSAPTS